jgi:hypothetical protein
MTKGKKIALAVATVWPFVWFVLFFCFMFGTVFWAVTHEGTKGGAKGMPWPFVLLFAGHFFTMLFIVGLTVFYVVYLFRTERVPQDKKALWAVVLLLGNVFAFPVFWYLFIWKEPETPMGIAPPPPI